jgi:hypothetical protein
MRPAIVVLVVLIASCATRQRSEPSLASHLCRADVTDGWPLTVSMIELIARPDEFDGKRVQLIGYVHLEFESQAIYLHEEDYRRSITHNGLWLDFTGPSAEQLCPTTGAQDRYMIVEGVFRKGPAGHFGMWPGMLTDISRFEGRTR